MKDLTDYLCTTINTSECPDSGAVKGKTISKSSINERTVQNSDITNVQNGKKKRRKKNKRKPSDPAVKNIVELLSNSLCIISPNTSFSNHPELQAGNEEQKQIVATDKIDKNKAVPAECSEIVVLDQDETNSCNVSNETLQNSVSHIETDKKDNEISKATNKLNAFQFMMESRNKSIGQNSPGKEPTADDANISDEKQSKEVLSARKIEFQNWSNKKGALKRKREDEEKEEMINYKLQKRTKRLKQLLKVEPKDAGSDVIVKNRRKAVRRISSSSSENSKDSAVILQDSNKVSTNSILGVIEENAQDKVFNESQRRDSKQGLLNFFGVVNKTKKSETVDGKSATEKEVIKIKLKSSKLKKKMSNEMVNQSSKNITEESSDADPVSVEQLSSKKKKKQQKCMEESSKKPKSPKTKNRTNDDGDGSFTPRSLKSWKMKIKINNEKNEKAEDEADPKEKRPQRSKRISDYRLLLSEESSSEPEIIHLQGKKQVKASEKDQIIVSSDEESNNKKKETPKPIKVAPVFTKATPKPKLAPEIVEARKQFLMSGIPDSLKRTIEKQQSTEEKDYDVFPSISHVQQKCDTQPFWSLPSPQLNLKACSPLKIEKPVMCASLTNSRTVNSINIQAEVEKVNKLKTLLNKIKSDNPNYPVYKSFRLIHEKSGKTFEKKNETIPKHKKSKKHASKSLGKNIEIVKPENNPTEHAMWTDKYKPKCLDDIIGNAEGIKTLKKWLEFWKNYTEEINAKKKKREDYCSDSEFDTTDCDSRESTKLSDNTIVVGGPCGSGKSTAIYALCNELGFNVIELNASSKRTGKRLLQELQEATQSHQVRKKKHMQSFFEAREDQQTDKKICVLLIEDVDIVFEQDDGFISALSQLVSSSKRPVVLTTTDTSSVYVQKFISQYKHISFLPLSSQSLATWLQIVCLVEGLFVNQGDIGSLLEYNKGDVRKTLLQLQFWVQSGGQIVRDNLSVKTKAGITVMEQKLVDDEQEPCLEEESEELQNIFVRSDCVRSFEIFKHHKPYRVPYYINLGLLWWNIPNILNIRSFSEDRIKKFKENHFELEGEPKALPKPQTNKLSPLEKTKLDSLSKLYDSLAFTDILFKTVNHCSNLEPDVKNYTSTAKDSLELEEILDGYDGYKDFVHEITHSLVNGYVEEFSNIEKTESVLNIAVPEKAERRWRAKMHVCEDVFLEALPLSTYIERRSVALDYMPYLRNISRSESRRAANNTKRGNRFRNYLRDLGIKHNDNTVKLACNILRGNDF